MKSNDGHTLSLTLNDENVEWRVNCPFQGQEATEDTKCASADIGAIVDDCAVAEAVAGVGSEAISTGGEDVEVAAYPIPVEWYYEDDDLYVSPVVQVASENASPTE